MNELEESPFRLQDEAKENECIICHDPSDRLLKFADCLCTPTLKARNSRMTQGPRIRVHEDCLSRWYATTQICIVCRHPLSKCPETCASDDEMEDLTFGISPPDWDCGESIMDGYNPLRLTPSENIPPTTPPSVISFVRGNMHHFEIYRAQGVDASEIITDQQDSRVITVVDPTVETGHSISSSSGTSTSSMYADIRGSHCCMPFCPM